MDPVSNKRFQRLVLSAISVPLFFLGAFLAFAAGHWPLALVVLALGLLLATLVPYRPAIDSPISRRDRITERSVSTLVLVAALYGLWELPETRALLYRLSDGVTLFNAPVLTVVTLWALLKAYRSWEILRGLNDREIENYILGYEEIRFQGPFHRKRRESESRSRQSQRRSRS